MPPSDPTSVKDRRRKERRRWAYAFAASVLGHLLLILLFGAPPPPPNPYAASGPDTDDDDDASGSMQVIRYQLAQAAPQAVNPTARPVPVPLEIEIPQEELVVPSVENGLATMVMGEISLRPGRTAAAGRGNAGSGGSGSSTTVPPSPRGMIIPPTDDALRGRRVEVWVFVDASGRVVPDSTRLVPPTRDDDLNERLILEAAEWVFSPAKRLGEPVAAWFPYTISMGGGS